MTDAESTTTPRTVSFSAQFLHAAPDAIVVIDAHGLVRLANHRAVELFGYTEGELVGQPVEILVPDDQRDGHEAQRAGYEASPRIRRMGDPRSQVSGERADGTRVPIEIALSPVVVDSERFVMAIVRDVTDRVNAEREQSLIRQRLAVVEDRDRIARDLHDLVIQRIFATGMRLQAAINDPVGLRERTVTAVAELDETIAVIRESIFRLTHNVDGVTTLIRSLVAEHDASVQCQVTLEVEGDLDAISSDISEHLLPTLNEALANVVRHARASSVAVTVRATDELELRVIDDGVGFDADATPGFGLANLTQRASQLQGTMQINRIADGGTDLRWIVPIER